VANALNNYQSSPTLGRELTINAAAGDLDDEREQQDLRRSRSQSPLTTGTASNFAAGDG